MSAAAKFAATFVSDLAEVRLPNVFNPYSDVCPQHDRADAPKTRRENLRSVLEAASAGGVDGMWVGLELGHGGGRRTGLPMTDDKRLAALSAAFGLEPLKSPTTSGAASELTSGAVWEAIGSVNRRILLWNVFPLHPHKPGVLISNRRHSAPEAKIGRTFLLRLLENLQPPSLVAIGRHSEKSLSSIHQDFQGVRHPAYGGKAEFLDGIAAHYSV